MINCFHSIRLVIACSLTWFSMACNNAPNTTEDRLADTLQQSPLPVTVIQGKAGLLHIDDGGTGGLPVVFVHSFGGSTEQWAAQLAHFRKERRALALDYRGHGLSQAPADSNYAVTAIAEDIAVIVDSLKINRFVLVGHSMGGSAAIAYAGTHPGRVAALVVTGTPGKTPEAQYKPIIASLESPAYDKIMDDYMKQLLTGAKPSTNASEREGMKKISKAVSIKIINEVFRFDPVPFLKKYSGPALIISTEKEEKQPNSLAKLFPAIPHKTVTGTSHWIQMDKPDEFNNILDDFFKTVK